MHVRPAIATFTLLAAGLAGCASDIPQGTPPPAVQTESTDPLPEPTEDTTDPLPSDEPSDEPTEDPTKKFGQTFTWEDGLAVTVSKPKPYRPGEYASYDKSFHRWVKVTITVKNGTKKRYDPSSMTVQATTGDDDSDEVYDSEMGGTPDAKVLKGKTRRFQQAWAVEKGQDFVMEIAPDYDHEEAIFTS